MILPWSGDSVRSRRLEYEQPGLSADQPLGIGFGPVNLNLVVSEQSAAALEPHSTSLRDL